MSMFQANGFDVNPMPNAHASRQTGEGSKSSFVRAPGSRAVLARHVRRLRATNDKAIIISTLLY